VIMPRRRAEVRAASKSAAEHVAVGVAAAGARTSDIEPALLRLSDGPLLRPSKAYSYAGPTARR
jgi:hypothetical protein